MALINVCFRGKADIAAKLLTKDEAPQFADITTLMSAKSWQGLFWSGAGGTWRELAGEKCVWHKGK